MGEFRLNNQESDFQNVFEFPDFVEMRPVLRDAVRSAARESFERPELPVKVERATTALEEQLERETRKYERQMGVYPNQTTELNALVRLYTHILQIISRATDITPELEDIIYAVNQTRLSLIQLPKLVGVGELYREDRDQELIPDTFYDYVTTYLVKPYLIDPSGQIVPANVQKAGRQLVVKMTTYAYRDWDAYLTHEYDEQHIVKNRRGLTNGAYYQQLEAVELKYADKVYSKVLADVYQAFKRILIPAYTKQFEIMTTPLSPILRKAPQVKQQLDQIIRQAFHVDTAGAEHVMDNQIQAIKNKYQFYRENFT